jgi:hypothetical protein
MWLMLLVVPLAFVATARVQVAALLDTVSIANVMT